MKSIDKIFEVLLYYDDKMLSKLKIKSEVADIRKEDNWPQNKVFCPLFYVIGGLVWKKEEVIT